MYHKGSGPIGCIFCLRCFDKKKWTNTTQQNNWPRYTCPCSCHLANLRLFNEPITELYFMKIKLLSRHPGTVSAKVEKGTFFKKMSLLFCGSQASSDSFCHRLASIVSKFRGSWLRLIRQLQLTNRESSHYQAFSNIHLFYKRALLLYPFFGG